MKTARSFQLAAILASAMVGTCLSEGCENNGASVDSDASPDVVQQPDSDWFVCGNLGVLVECIACIRTTCCSEALTCSESTDCSELVGCTRRCVEQSHNPADCQSSCREDHPQGAILIDSLSACVKNSCKVSSCGLYSSGAIFTGTEIDSGLPDAHKDGSQDAPDGTGESGSDADAKPEADTGVADTSVDTKEDTQVDSGAEAQVDSSVDTKEDAQVDSGAEAQVDSSVDTKEDAQVDAGAEAQVDSSVDTKLDVQVDSDAEVQSDASFDTKLDAPVDTTGDSQGDTSADSQQDVIADTADSSTDLDPIAWFAFDESSGTSVLDKSGNGHNGTHNASYVAGKKGSAVELGPTSTVTIPMSPALAWGKADANFSVLYWIRVLTPSTSYQNILHHGNSDNERTSTHFLGPGGVQACNVVSTVKNPNDYFCSGSFALGIWTHLADVKDGNVHTIYINGVPDSFQKLSSASLGFDAPIYMGKSPWYAGAHVILDEVKVFARALSPAEIQSESTP